MDEIDEIVRGLKRLNHVRLGPVILRIGSHNLAPWGWPRIQIGGLSIGSRTIGINGLQHRG